MNSVNKEIDKILADASQKYQGFGELTAETKAKLAKKLGVDPDSIQARRHFFTLELCREGVLIDLDIGYCRGHVRASASDFGLDNPTEEEKEVWEKRVLSFGTISVLPADVSRKLVSVERRARDYLDEHSYKSPWGRYVHYKLFNEVYGYLLDRQEEFKQLISEITDETTYTKMKLDFYNDCVSLARSAYRRVYNLPQDAPVPDDFIEAFVAGKEPAFPSLERLQKSYFAVRLEMVPTAAMLEADEQVRLLVEKTGELQRRELELREAELTEQERLRQRQEEEKMAMYRAVLQQQQENLSRTLDSFSSGIAAQLHGLVYDFAVNVLESLRKNDDKLVGKSAQKIRNHIQKIKNLNILGDQDIERAIEEIESFMNLKPAKRDTDDLARVLRDIATINRKVLLDLGETPRSGRMVGIADVVTDEAVRRIRDRAIARTYVKPVAAAPRQVRVSAAETKIEAAAL
ncbi:hypothetical protein Tfer_0847 [Thermincola ferriacetica]|uniref:Uncharacterized protein n=1 Tax=Thermincola ferriacetica TaxID=281456 RepID=A0A0L6W3X8_9FIRM|nr:hypothetical protein [Thermincola ferriacetica]KNZ70287.1 hypothetical protein Tfer_0847 [Thermincola ferriacetica]